MTTPTPEGMRRYPYTQGYFPDLSAEGVAPDLDLPCTCVADCPRCAGECGCKACSMAFTDFCDEARWLGPDGLRDEAAALASYRDVKPSV